MPVDNFHIIRDFCPEKDDGDSFIYTEMLDRSKTKGNNGVRLLKTFYHRSREEFDSQRESIIRLCELSQARACTRLGVRSYAKVGATFTRLVVEASLTANWQGMKSLYNRACGITRPEKKLWLFDVDEVDEGANRFFLWLCDNGHSPVVINSKKGLHFVVGAFNTQGTPAEARGDGYLKQYPNIQLHKDNPTNLYIPDQAA